MDRIYSCITLDRLKVVLLLSIGFTIGYTFVILTSLETNKSNNIHSAVWKNDSTVAATENVTGVRILCYLHTSPSFHANKSIHIRELWGKHCDKLLFASTSTDLNIKSTAFNVTDSHDYLWGKTKYMMQHIYNDYIDDYDWFFKGDDDTFLIAENLRYLLSSYSTDDPIYFGQKFNVSLHRRGYFAGGTGYVMSRKTVRIFVENVLTNKDFMGTSQNCRIGSDNENEDDILTRCLDEYNVYAGDSRDAVNHERFPDNLWMLYSERNMKHWYFQHKYYYSDPGNCCSKLSISFHHIPPKEQYSLYYANYKLRPYGIDRRFPPPPQIKNFTDVERILDLQTTNATLRGF